MEETGRPNGKMMIPNQTSPLLENDSLLLACLECLPTADVLRLQQLSKRHQGLITNNSQIQYKALLDQLGIEPAPTTSSTEMSWAAKLARVQQTQDRLSSLRFGSDPALRGRAEVDDWMSVIPGDIAEMDDRIYFAGGYNQQTQEATHIEVLDLKNVEGERKRLEFGHPIRTFLVDALEGVVVVGWLEEEFNYVQIVYMHRIQVYKLSTSQALTPAFKVPWSLVQMRKASQMLSIWGGLLGVCCLVQDDYTKGMLKVLDWKKGVEIFEHRFEESARLRACEIVSSRALVAVVADGPALDLCLIAVGPSSTPSASLCGHYRLPKLHSTFSIRNVAIVSSAPSLSCASKDNSDGSDDVLKDGEGIISLSLYVSGDLVDSKGNAGSRWANSLVAMIQTGFFHREALACDGQRPTVAPEWKEWGPANVHWPRDLPHNTTRESICGYRVLTTGVSELHATTDTQRELQVSNWVVTFDYAGDEHLDLVLYDYNPRTIKRLESGSCTLGEQDGMTLVAEDSKPFLNHTLIFAEDPTSHMKRLVTRRKFAAMPLLGFSAQLSHKRVTLRALRERATDPSSFFLEWQLFPIDAPDGDAPEVRFSTKEKVKDIDRMSIIAEEVDVVLA